MDVKLGDHQKEKSSGITRENRITISPTQKTLVVDDDVAAVCESAVVTPSREMGIKAEWVDSGRKAIDQVKASGMKASILT